MSIARQIDHSVRRNQPRSLGKAQPKRREPGVPPPPTELACGHPASDSNLRLDVAAAMWGCRACERPKQYSETIAWDERNRQRVTVKFHVSLLPTHCRRGHLYDRGDGMGVRIGSKGERRCRECVNESARRSRARRVALRGCRERLQRWQRLYEESLWNEYWRRI